VLENEGHTIASSAGISRAGVRKIANIRAALVRCDCGTERLAPIKKLFAGRLKSCGNACPHMIRLGGTSQAGRPSPLRGVFRTPAPAFFQRFGNLTVLIPEGRSRRRPGSPPRRSALVVCDCGSPMIAVPIDLLTKGVVTRCKGSPACLEGLSHKYTRTGCSGTPEHNAWRNMLDRCYNPNCRGYADYGARGITVCERWRLSFHDFLADMGRRLSNRHSIDRIDNDGNYEPGNCRWATQKEQQGNRRNTAWIEFKGCVTTIGDLAKEYGMPHATLYNRVKRGWPESRWLDPVKK
jgi:hypothetical protein